MYRFDRMDGVLANPSQGRPGVAGRARSIHLDQPVSWSGRMTLDRRNLPAVREGELDSSSTIPHLDMLAVRRLIDVAQAAPKTVQRNALLIATLVDGCLRVSEALGLRPVGLIQSDMGWAAWMGTGRKSGMVALSNSFVGQLHAYAYRLGLPEDNCLFPVSRGRVHQIVTEAAELADISISARVGAVHVLRHSGAIASLTQTGNPKALQNHLRLSSSQMTPLYLETIQAQRSLEIQQGVDFGW